MKAKWHPRRWTEEDRGVLRAMYPTAPISQLAERLGRSPGAIEGMASTMGLRRDTPATRSMAKRSWTEEERHTLRAMFPSDPIATIAQRLGRSQGAIYSQAAALRLSRVKRGPRN